MNHPSSTFLWRSKAKQSTLTQLSFLTMRWERESVTTTRVISFASVLLMGLFFSVPVFGQVDAPPLNTQAEEPVEIEIELRPVLPSAEASMRWSPKGEKLKLTDTEFGPTASFTLGPKGTPSMSVRLEKSASNSEFDRLRFDSAGDGFDEQDRVVECQPSERNGKIWSSFRLEHVIHHVNDETATKIGNQIGLNLWYVRTVDPETKQEQVIRFNVTGWMQGSKKIGDSTVHVLLFDRTMDGTYGESDSWALGSEGHEADIFSYLNDRRADDFNWAGDRAFTMTRMGADGRAIWVRSFDPGMTREADVLKRDPIAPDRLAKRSKTPVAFLHDYDEAQQKANASGLPLLLDFETTWCGPCKTMDRWVYTAEEVVKASAGVVSVKLDGDVEKELVKKYDVKAYPTLVLVTPSGEVIARAQGYQSVKEVTRLLKNRKQPE